MAFKKWDERTEDEKAYAVSRLTSPESKAKAAETRKRNKNLRDLTRFMLEAELDTDDEVRYMLEARGFEASEQGAMVYALLNKARAGDVEAFKTLRDTSGQKPVEHQTVDLSAKPSEMDLSSLSTEQLMEMYEKYRYEDEE